MGHNRQFAINMIAGLFTFAVGVAIRFILTPFIVRVLGAEAYGFIGLSANLLSYTGLITVALNSMAGRFVTIAYSSGQTHQANLYFSSVFFSNLVLAGIILILTTVCLIWLEYLINIPEELVVDVKILFGLSAFNSVIGLIASVWNVSPFIKNRLDISNTIGIVGSIINVILLYLLYTRCVPRLWYLGMAGLVTTAYSAVMGRIVCSRLTPELVLRISNFRWKEVVELLKSGVWNLISKLGEILGTGLDLLIANICIGSLEMGLFAITKNVPFLILGLFQTIAGVFAPILTNLYAQKNTDGLMNELNKSIRILSLFTAIPLACLYVYGDVFYALWLPEEDARYLQFLTILGTFALPFTLPLESLWNIFTVTNKLKGSTLFMLGNNVLVFMVVMSSMLFVESHHIRLLILASTRSIIGILRGIFFLPMYGAYCLEVPRNVFYSSFFRALVYLAVTMGLSFLLRLIYLPDSWGKLILAGIAITGICLATALIIVLKPSDRTYLLNMLQRK